MFGLQYIHKMAQFFRVSVGYLMGYETSPYTGLTKENMNTSTKEIMQNSSIVRNRLKIKSAITNAQQFIKIQESYGSFDSFIWSYVDGKPILNQFQTETDIPARTALSDQISKDLKELGFKFVGSTIIYAYMQAIGIVNDHVKGCHLYANKWHFTFD